jgi:hypothetical protein
MMESGPHRALVIVFAVTTLSYSILAEGQSHKMGTFYWFFFHSRDEF